MNTLEKKQSGFTIIEVVLVLAIAGLIFLMIFIALPALQRGQRDAQRKTDVGRFMSQITAYQSNSRGNVPAASNAGIVTPPNGFVEKYLKVDGDTFQDPQLDSYSFVYGAGGAPVAGTIRYATAAKCNDDGSIAVVSGARKVAVSTGLEGGGAYCQDN